MIDVIDIFINNRIRMKHALVVGIFAIVCLLAPNQIYAQAASQGTTGNTTRNWNWVDALSFGGAINSPAMSSQNSIFSSAQYLMESFACLGIGVACTDKVQDLPTSLCNSAMGKFNEVIAQTFTTPPADTGLWLADTGRTLGFLPKQAMAQGIGFSGMMPLLPLWKAFRNIAYLLMALVMVVLGFMIMFRKKIDPHTVVTAQNAIPKVVIALILITFSYAIVGIAIDIMYVLIYFFIALFKSSGLLQSPQFPACYWAKTPEKLYGQGGLLANFFNLSWDPLKIMGLNQGSSINTGQFSTLLGMVGIPAVIALFSGGAYAGAAAVGIGMLTLPLIHLILTVAVIFLFIRLLFFFLGAYIQIVVSLLIAPLQLMLEAIPGSSSFTNWFKNLVSNLAVFPIGAIMFMLSNVFTSFSNDPSGQIWAPPYSFLSGNSSQVASLVSLGILFAIPQIAGSVKELLKAQPLFGGSSAGGSLQTALPFVLQMGGMYMQNKSMERSLAPLHKLTGGALKTEGHEEHK